jgi:hypothetical protein
MKKTFFLAYLLCTINFLQAQEANTVDSNPNNAVQKSTGKKSNQRQSPEQRADKFTQNMLQSVALEETQKTKVRSLALDHFNAVENARKQANGDKEKIKLAAKDSRKIFNQGLKQVLTPAQFEKWKSVRKEASKNKNGAPVKEVETIED